MHMKQFFLQYKARHIWLVSVAICLILFSFFKNIRQAMNFLVAITKPIKRVLGKFCSLFPFSVAELLVVLAILGILFIIVWIIIRLDN